MSMHTTRGVGVVAALALIALVSCSGDDGAARLDPSVTSPLSEAQESAGPQGAIIGDGFDGPGADLEAQAVPWRVVEGRWTVDAGTLVLLEAAGPFPSLAVTDTGGPDGSIAVTMVEVANNAGLVFRYRDRSNYWALMAAPAFVTWNLIKVVDGQREQIANTDVADVDAFTSIGVRLSGSTIEATVNGRVRLSVEDPFLSDATAAGFTAGGEDSLQARWDDFFAIGIRETDPPSDAPPATADETPGFVLELDVDDLPAAPDETEPEE